MSEQLELLNGDEFHDYKIAAQRTLSEIGAPTRDEYPLPHGPGGGASWGPNPLFTRNASREYSGAAAKQFSEPEEAWIPSYEIESAQDVVNSRSIKHMAENASGLDVPNINAYQFGDTTMVMDGNHRVNAALARGQMLIPANLRKAY